MTSVCLAFLPVFFLYARFSRPAQASGLTVMGGWAAWARLGYALAKVLLLVASLEEFVEVNAWAHPVAQNAKSIWLACFARLCQIYLATSAAADLVSVYASLRGHAVPENCAAPFRAGSFSGLWARWNLLAGASGRLEGNGTLKHVFISLGCVTLVQIFWGASIGFALIWMFLQAGLVMLDRWRGPGGLFAPLPMPLRVILVLAVLVATQALALPSHTRGNEGWLSVMFTPPPDLPHSLLLEARLTTLWLQTVVFVSFLACVAFPTLPWLLREASFTWKIVGLLAGGLGLFLPLRNVSQAPEVVRTLAQLPLFQIWGEGNEQVFIGREKWLFPRRELDRLTQVDGGPTAEVPLLSWSQRLQGQKTPLVLIPVPAKVALYPDKIFRAEYPGPLHPPGFAETLARLRASGIEVVDPAAFIWPELYRTKAALPQESHWPPAVMKTVANKTVDLVRKKWPDLHADVTPIVNAAVLERASLGDLSSRLMPWRTELWFDETWVDLVAITGLAPDPASPILLVGSEALFIYDDPGLSFGDPEGTPQSAGFVAQLSALLARPLDVRAVPEGGPALSRALKELEPALAGKKLVICLVRADEL